MSKRNDWSALLTDVSNNEVVIYSKEDNELFRMDGPIALLICAILILFTFGFAIFLLVLILLEVFYFEVVKKGASATDRTE